MSSPDVLFKDFFDAVIKPEVELLKAKIRSGSVQKPFDIQIVFSAEESAMIRNYLGVGGSPYVSFHITDENRHRPNPTGDMMTAFLNTMNGLSFPLFYVHIWSDGNAFLSSDPVMILNKANVSTHGYRKR